MRIELEGRQPLLRRDGVTDRSADEGWLVIEQDQFLRATDTPESVVAVQRANREYLRGFGF